MTIPAAAGQCGANVSYGNPTVADNCGVDVVWLSKGLSKGSYFGVGQSNITFAVNDTSGLDSSCTFSLTVTDTQPPTIGE